MMSLTFGLFNQVSGLGPLGPLVYVYCCFNPVFVQKNLIMKLVLIKLLYGDFGYKTYILRRVLKLNCQAT